jgi:hypothetical protein
VGQVAEHLPSKHEALSLIPSIAKKKKKEKVKGFEIFIKYNFHDKDKQTNYFCF